MSKENPYHDGKMLVRKDALFDVTMNVRRGVGTLTLGYTPPNAKFGHYKEVEVTIGRHEVGWIVDALYDYLESEEADIRKLRDRLQGQGRG
jgi:hypothetical protein